MLTDLTYQVLSEYFKYNNDPYVYEDSFYKIQIVQSLINSNKVFNLVLFYKSHVVYACGGYKDLNVLLTDLSKANNLYESIHLVE